MTAVVLDTQLQGYLDHLTNGQAVTARFDW